MSPVRKMPTRISLKICCVLSSSAAVMYLINKSVVNSSLVQNIPNEYSWIVRGLMNILSYATLFIPGYLTYKYVSNFNYTNLGGDSWGVRFIRTCFGDEDTNASTTNSNVSLTQRSMFQEVVVIMFHFFGLQISYLTWGVLQEKVMTQEYHSKDSSEYFKDSQFLVFVNRILSFFISGIYLYCKKQSRHRCPMYKYAFCSVSNVMSSWCQYEALKFVSFPHQVLAKAAKTIPVMIMGKLISKTEYKSYEYITSIILSIGMLLFMLDVGNDRATSTMTTVSGAILLCFYIIFDSFTSNWQGALFKTYSITPVEMMCLVNLYSFILTACSLLQQGTFFNSVNFMFRYPQFMVDCSLLSICSATGQLFIFSTISKFGPLMFAVITTIRQGFSVLLSCIIYNHHVDVSGMLGLSLVFISMFLRIYCGYRLRKKAHSIPQRMLV